jgi:hypothetical protein
MQGCFIFVFRVKRKQMTKLGGPVMPFSEAVALVSVIPAQAGIQCRWRTTGVKKSLGPRLRGDDMSRH